MLEDLQTTVDTFQEGLPAGPGLIVPIIAGVNSNNTPDMAIAGQWFPVAQQVQVIAGNGGFEDLELLMQDPLPAMPTGGYYIIEVNPGYVNTSFIDNSIKLNGKSSGGLRVTGDSFGARVIGNLFYGGTNYDNESTGNAISALAEFNTAGGNGTDAFPIGWTVLPDLGTLIEDNVVQDALRGRADRRQPRGELRKPHGFIDVRCRAHVRHGERRRQHLRAGPELALELGIGLCHRRQCSGRVDDSSHRDGWSRV